jgi:hypothetical protein
VEAFPSGLSGRRDQPYLAHEHIIVDPRIAQKASRASYASKLIGIDSTLHNKQVLIATTMPHPDEKVHPVATGLAKQTVDAHQDEQDIVLWSAWVSWPLETRSLN